MSWFNCLYRMYCCNMCCDHRLWQLQLNDLVLKNSRTTWYRLLPPNFYDLLDWIICHDHWLCNICQGILKSAQKNSLFLKSLTSSVTASMFQSHYDLCCRFAFEENSFCPIVAVMLPRFAQQSKFPPKFYDLSYCRSAACVLTAVLICNYCLTVLTLHLLPGLAPGEGDNAHEHGATLQDHCGAT
jgi:hypothetical protein